MTMTATTRGAWSRAMPRQSPSSSSSSSFATIARAVRRGDVGFESLTSHASRVRDAARGDRAAAGREGRRTVCGDVVGVGGVGGGGARARARARRMKAMSDKGATDAFGPRDDGKNSDASSGGGAAGSSSSSSSSSSSRGNGNGNGGGNGDAGKLSKSSSKSSSSGSKKSLSMSLKSIFDSDDAKTAAAERERWRRLLNSAGRATLLIFVAPWVCAQSVKSAFITPWLGAHWNDLHRSLNVTQKQRVADGIQKFEQRLYYDRITSGAKAPTADEHRDVLREEARKLEAIERKRSFEATGNALGSLVFITMTVTIITLQKMNIARLLNEMSDEFISLDAATQAFILMLGADMVVGYHSSDGWQALLACFITHYGFNYEHFEMAVRIFVAVVPVTLDLAFKYWVFNKLRKISPSTQIILGEIERH